MVAILEDKRYKEPIICEVKQTLIEKNSSMDDQIPLMVNDLAFQIAHRLGEQSVQSKEDYPSTWQAFKYMIQGKEAYFSYIATNNVSDLDNARKLALAASHYEPGYIKPF